ncbi:hypothetical protein D3C87_2069050 [compost metagenome]
MAYDVEGSLISKPATDSFTIGNDDHVSLADKALTIALVDVAFNGAGEGAVSLIDGGYFTSNPATLSIVP